MKRMRTMLIVFVLVVCTAACQPQKQLVVGMESDFRPMSFQENKELKGFEVDLWKAIAKEAGLSYRLQPMSASEILKSVEKKKMDAGLAGFTINGERKKNVEFSMAYYTAGLRVLSRHKDQVIRGPKDLKGKVVATRIGTTGYRYSAYLKDIKAVKAYPQIEQAYDALARNEADVVIFDGPVVSYFAKSDAQNKVHLSESSLTKEQYGIVLRTGSPFTGRINNALRELGKNGTYEQIYVKWFGEKPKSYPGKK